MLSLSINDKFGFDFKPQYAFTSMILNIDSDDIGLSGPGGVLVSGTLNYSFAKHWAIAFNLDYLSTKFNKQEGNTIDDFEVSTFSTTLGVQYKF